MRLEGFLSLIGCLLLLAALAAGLRAFCQHLSGTVPPVSQEVPLPS